MQIINDCQPDPSIIKDYSKLTDNQLEVNVQKGYEDALLEKTRRESLKLCPHTTNPLQLKRLCKQCRGEPGITN